MSEVGKLLFDNGSEMLITYGVTELGRSCPCFNGVLCVSRRHASITATSQRRIGDTVNSVRVDWLQDLNSEHGTFVNGCRVQGAGWYQLRHGTRLGFAGPLTFGAVYIMIPEPELYCCQLISSRLNAVQEELAREKDLVIRLQSQLRIAQMDKDEEEENLDEAKKCPHCQGFFPVDRIKSHRTGCLNSKKTACVVCGKKLTKGFMRAHMLNKHHNQ